MAASEPDDIAPGKDGAVHQAAPALPGATSCATSPPRSPVVQPDVWPEVKARIQARIQAPIRAAYQAPSRAIARDPARGVVADLERGLPSAVTCFRDGPGSSPGQAFEACIAPLRMPVTHRRVIRTTDEIDRRVLDPGGMVLSRGRPRGEARRGRPRGEARRGRPRGEARRVGCRRRRAPRSSLAGSSRPRTASFDGRAFHRSTKRSRVLSACSASRRSRSRSALTVEAQVGPRRLPFL